jgi:hypothetical protein
MPKRRVPNHGALREFEASFARYLRGLRRPGPGRKSSRNLDDGGVPVEPNRRRNLSGGAAAALEFDD